MNKPNNPSNFDGNDGNDINFTIKPENEQASPAQEGQPQGGNISDSFRDVWLNPAGVGGTDEYADAVGDDSNASNGSNDSPSHSSSHSDRLHSGKRRHRHHRSSDGHHRHRHHSHPSASSHQTVQREPVEWSGESFDSSKANAEFRAAVRRKRTSWKKVVVIVICVILALLLCAGGILFCLYRKGQKSLLDGKAEPVIPDNVPADTDGEGGIVYGDEKYVYNENITNILVLGIDRRHLSDADKNGTGGQADAVYLLSIDTLTGAKKVISISRDSMTDVDVYSAGGTFTGTEKMQLCLAYSYGDGKHTSCENTVKAVSRLMYGIPIQSYVAIDLDAIETLTDAVGGVTVPEYDSDQNPTGANQFLTGKNVKYYVQFRDTSKLDSNNNRRERQMNFIKAFSSKVISETKADITFPIALYNSVEDDIATNIDISRLTYLATLGVRDSAVTYDSVAGSVTAGEEFAEFNIDENALYELVLETFYIKK